MKFLRAILLSLSVLVAASVSAQEKTPQQLEKELQENIDKEIDHYTDILGLDRRQVFYVDSILHHDYQAMQDELSSLGRSKVSNPDLYLWVQDKWSEQMYNAFAKILTKDQWEKYQKTGALKAKKARDKRKTK